jgi:iron complex transport system ATP-binding protein
VSELELRDVEVRYGARLALAPFSERIPPGEWVGLIGPNGAGKSTLLRAVVGLVDRRGDVLVGGDSVAELSPRRRAALVAYVPQEPILPTDMSVFDYVLLGRSPFIRYFASESRHDHEVTERAMAQLDLDRFARRRVDELSGGERQRVVLARALAQEAPILLLDEPTSALDLGHQQQALELVARLRRDHALTVVSAMHDLTLAGMYADRLVLLHEGVRVASGSASDVLSAETLLEFYGVRVSVHRESDGTVVVVPRRDVRGR